VVYKQIEFVQTKNLGYDKVNIIYLQLKGKIAENLETSLSEIKNIPGIVNASSTLHTLMGTYSTTSGLNWTGKAPDDDISFEDISIPLPGCHCHQIFAGTRSWKSRKNRRWLPGLE
jgi:hypothetical protein